MPQVDRLVSPFASVLRLDLLHEVAELLVRPASNVLLSLSQLSLHAVLLELFLALQRILKLLLDVIPLDVKAEVNGAIQVNDTKAHDFFQLSKFDEAIVLHWLVLVNRECLANAAMWLFRIEENDFDLIKVGWVKLERLAALIHNEEGNVATSHAVKVTFQAPHLAIGRDRVRLLPEMLASLAHEVLALIKAVDLFAFANSAE